MGLEEILVSKNKPGRGVEVRREWAMPRCIPLHGIITQVYCHECQKPSYFDNMQHFPAFSRGQALPCLSCPTKIRAEGKRTIKTLIPRLGLLPAIVLYGGPSIKGDAIPDVEEADLKSKPDLVLVVGTTLHVAGARGLVNRLQERARSSGARGMRTIFLDQDLAPATTTKWFDVGIKGDAQIRQDGIGQAAIVRSTCFMSLEEGSRDPRCRAAPPSLQERSWQAPM